MSFASLLTWHNGNIGNTAPQAGRDYSTERHIPVSPSLFRVWRRNSAPLLDRALIWSDDAPPFFCICFERLVTYVDTPVSLPKQPMQIGHTNLICSLAINSADSLPKKDLIWEKADFACSLNRAFDYKNWLFSYHLTYHLIYTNRIGFTCDWS